MERKIELCICGKKHQGNEKPRENGYGGGMRAVCYGKECYQCPKGEGHWFFALKNCLQDSKHYKYSSVLKQTWKDDWACGYHRNLTPTPICKKVEAKKVELEVVFQSGKTNDTCQIKDKNKNVKGYKLNHSCLLRKHISEIYEKINRFLKENILHMKYINLKSLPFSNEIYNEILSLRYGVRKMIIHIKQYKALIMPDDRWSLLVDLRESIAAEENAFHLFKIFQYFSNPEVINRCDGTHVYNESLCLLENNENKGNYSFPFEKFFTKRFDEFFKEDFYKLEDNAKTEKILSESVIGFLFLKGITDSKEKLNENYPLKETTTYFIKKLLSLVKREADDFNKTYLDIWSYITKHVTDGKKNGHIFIDKSITDHLFYNPTHPRFPYSMRPSKIIRVGNEKCYMVHRTDKEETNSDVWFQEKILKEQNEWLKTMHKGYIASVLNTFIEKENKVRISFICYLICTICNSYSYHFATSYQNTSRSLIGSLMIPGLLYM